MFSFASCGSTLGWAGRIAAMAVATVCMAWTLKAVLGTIQAGLSGRWVDGAALLAPPVDPADLVEFVILVPMLGLDVVLAGWQHSSLRRLLQPSRSSWRDIAHLVFAVSGFMQIIILLATFGLLQRLVLLCGYMPTASLVSGWPVWLAVPTLYAITEFSTYWMHRLMHTRLMWPVHAVHHSAEDFTMLNSLRSTTINNFCDSLAFAVPAALLGFTPDAMLFAGVIWVIESTFAHSNIPGFYWLERIGLFSPRAHRLHHSLAPEHHDRNFGSLISVFDRLFGTYLPGDSATGAISLGVDDPEAIYNSGNALRDMLLPQWVWLRGLGEVGKYLAMHRSTPAREEQRLAVECSSVDGMVPPPPKML